MKEKNKSAVLHVNNDGMYRLVKLQNTAFAIVGSKKYRVDSLLTEEEADTLSRDRTIDVTLKGMKE